MKISATVTSALFLAFDGSASAFVGPAAESRCSLPLHMSDPRQETKGFASSTIKNAPMIDEQEIPKTPLMSTAIPFMKASFALDGRMAGDVGFDPFGFADSQENLNNYREAEIKHARLAMLAVAGWPLSELFNKKFATMLDMEPILDATNRAPSVLNGGLGRISPAYWIGCLGLAAVTDIFGSFFFFKKEGYFPGNFGFDPFGLYPKDEQGKKRMQLSEIKHGRLAMIAITAFAAQEFVSETAVIDHASIFFKPITQVLSDQALSGLNVVPIEDLSIEDVAPAVDAAVEAATSAAATSAPDAIDAAATSAAATSAPDAIVAATAEAATVIPPVDVVPAATAEAAVATPPMEIAPSASIPSTNDAELAAAKERIAELEAQLSKISNISP